MVHLKQKKLQVIGFEPNGSLALGTTKSLSKSFFILSRFEEVLMFDCFIKDYPISSSKADLSGLGLDKLFD